MEKSQALVTAQLDPPKRQQASSQTTCQEKEIVFSTWSDSPSFAI